MRSRVPPAAAVSRPWWRRSSGRRSTSSALSDATPTGMPPRPSWKSAVSELTSPGASSRPGARSDCSSTAVSARSSRSETASSRAVTTICRGRAWAPPAGSTSPPATPPRWPTPAPQPLWWRRRGRAMPSPTADPRSMRSSSARMTAMSPLGRSSCPGARAFSSPPKAPREGAGGARRKAAGRQSRRSGRSRTTTAAETRSPPASRSASHAGCRSPPPRSSARGPARACSPAPARREEAGGRERCEHHRVAGDARKAGMDFELSDEQAAFRELMRDFARREIKPVAREMEQSGRYPAEIVEQMRELGLFGLLVAPEHGGAGVDAVSYAIVFEELARAWMGISGIIGTHSMATLLLSRYGTQAQQQRWLPDLASGARRSGLALTEPGAGSDLQAITTVAARDGEEYVLRGTKTWITNARHADPLPVLVKTDPAAQPRHRGMSITVSYTHLTLPT